MNINVRLSAGLAPLAGNSRLQATLTEEATLADLLDYLQAKYPTLAPELKRAIPMVAGQHAGPSQSLSAGQEVALLLPVAGGK